MYERGKVNSFDELLNKFVRFLTSNVAENNNPWELLKHDVNHSFYGTTLKVPIPKYKTNDNRIPCFYVSFQHTLLKKTTYSNWLRTVECPEYERGKSGELPRPFNAETYKIDTRVRYDVSMYSDRKIYTKYGEPNVENPFVEPGEFIAVGLHTLYDERLWMCEQGGITCEDETREYDNKLNLLEAREILMGGIVSDTPIKLPRFPGTGCPWLTMTDSNAETYTIREGNLEYWFTKDDYSATISIRFSNNGLLPDMYQSINFGMMDTFADDSYRFPLYVAGGNQGLREDYWRYVSPVYGGLPTITGANSYDLDITNPALSNNNLLHPCKFNLAELSNFKVLAPEGIWRNIWNVEQKARIQNYFSCGVIYEWGQILDKPTFDIGTKSDTTFPWGTDNRWHGDSHLVIFGANKDKRGGLTQDVLVVFNKEDVGIKGRIPRASFCWSRQLPHGEIMIGTKRFLSIPCVWESRLWDYDGYIGTSNDQKFWDARKLSEIHTKNAESSWTNKMVSRLLISLE